jgi:hypothetical protein
MPAPDGDASLVRHVLQFDDGRSPYMSTTEHLNVAKLFAGATGTLWRTVVARIQSAELRWIGRSELLQLLQAGVGITAWPRPSDLLEAQHHVECDAEHVVDVRSLKGEPDEVLRAVVGALFSKEGE